MVLTDQLYTVGLTLRRRDAKVLNQSKNKCSGCFKKILIS